jgi:hypothetical protein
MSLRRWGSAPPSVEEVVSHMNVSAQEAQVIIDEMEKSLANPKKERPKINTAKWLIPFLRWPMLLFGLASLFLSCYYSIHWLGSQQSMAISWIMGITLIGFGLFSFEISIYQRQKGKKSWLLFLLVWCFIVLYNVSTILASLYSSYSVKITTSETQAVVTTAERQRYTGILDAIKDKEAILGSLQKKLIVQQQVLAEYDTRAKQLSDSKGYGNASWLVTVTEKEIKTLDKDIQGERVKTDELLKNNPNIMKEMGKENTLDFFAWISKLFRISPAMIQFILQVIPAMVLDVISAAALYVFLYLGREEKTV